MTRTGKAAAIAVGSIAVVAAGWAGAGIYAGRWAAGEMRSFAERAPARPGLTIAAPRHEAGLFESNGRFEVRFDEHCDPAAAGGAKFALQVEYRLSHMLLPGSMMRFEWSMVPAGQVGAVLSKVTNGALRIDGQGTVSYARGMESSIAMPEIVLGSGPQAMRMSASTGRFTVAGPAFGMQWKTERIAGRGAGKALEVLNLGMEMDLKDRSRGTGSLVLSVDRVGTGFGTLEGFRLLTAAEERGDRTDLTITPSLRSMTSPGQKAADLSMQVSVRDIHTASLETIQRIASESCSFRSLKPEEEQKLRASVRTLITGGLALGVTGVKGTIGGGSLEGFLKVELKKADAAAAAGAAPVAIDLARLLTSSGEVVIKGNAIKPDQREMAVGTGFATEVPGGLKAAFEYADGVLKANGRVFDAGPLQVALSTADRRLNTFLGVSMPANVEPKNENLSPEPGPAADAGGAPVPLANSASVRLVPNVAPAAPQAR
ncbi:MAG: DUF945 family protein [bacterium]|jgi:hypothetical protein|nr:YdgA family protein [Betaproteobacteria bacterium]